jgi:hypothetical protein
MHYRAVNTQLLTVMANRPATWPDRAWHNRAPAAPARFGRVRPAVNWDLAGGVRGLTVAPVLFPG